MKILYVTFFLHSLSIILQLNPRSQHDPECPVHSRSSMYKDLVPQSDHLH